MKIVEKYEALLPAVQAATRLISDATLIGERACNIVFDIDDTLIFDDQRQTPNVQIKFLLDVAKAHGCKVHLVTARERSKEVRQWTAQELKRHSIAYDSLALAPAKHRENMASVSAWKFAERARHKPVLLSVGDQWTDLIKVATDDALEVLDAQHKTSQSPWLLVKPEDGVTQYGLKLMA